MDTLKLYFKLAGSRIASQMQYPASFMMGVLTNFLASFIDVIGLWVIFHRFQWIDGWALSEIALMYGILNMSFALVEMFARGFDAFGRLIRQGHLDRILVRPQPIILQVLGQEFRTINIGRFLQGFIPFIYAVSTLKITSINAWSFITIGFLNGMMLFYALLMIQATLAFWASDSLEVMNAFTYGGMQAGQFPQTIYDNWFRKFFTFIVPIALCSYYPALLALNKYDASHYTETLVFVLLSPFVLGLLNIFAHKFFKFGLKYYSSVGG